MKTIFETDNKNKKMDVTHDNSRTNEEIIVDDNEVLIQQTLYRLTRGIPQRELKLMVHEANECEKLLEYDIQVLENELRRLEHDDDNDDNNERQVKRQRTENEEKEKDPSSVPDSGTTSNISSNTTAFHNILESPLTPLDRYWTASALLGRMRREMMLPSIPKTNMSSTTTPSYHRHPVSNTHDSNKKSLHNSSGNNTNNTTNNDSATDPVPNSSSSSNKRSNSTTPSSINHITTTETTTPTNNSTNTWIGTPSPNTTTPANTTTQSNVKTEYQVAKELIALQQVPAYYSSNATPASTSITSNEQQQRMTSTSTTEQSSATAQKQQHRNGGASTAQLLALWKKISSSKLAIVFKRPVRVEEAPGYTDKIVFPMDLSFIRKLIVSNKITSYQELHDKIGLICHNCVKYNGRETDYGRVARDFEAMADEYIKQAVWATSQNLRSKATSTPPPPTHVNVTSTTSTTSVLPATSNTTSSEVTTTTKKNDKIKTQPQVQMSVTSSTITNESKVPSTMGIGNTAPTQVVTSETHTKSTSSG